MKIIQIIFQKYTKPVLNVLVDDNDYDFLSKFVWYLLDNKTVQYASTVIEGKTILMHQMVLPCPTGYTPDHIDGNGLNNQRNNLRIATHSQQHQNKRKTKLVTSSQYKGVHWNKVKQRWHAQIKKDGKPKYLGLFSSEKDAALAYNRAALEMFGEFAQLNVIEKVQ